MHGFQYSPAIHRCNDIDFRYQIKVLTTIPHGIFNKIIYFGWEWHTACMKPNCHLNYHINKIVRENMNRIMSNHSVDTQRHGNCILGSNCGSASKQNIEQSQQIHSLYIPNRNWEEYIYSYIFRLHFVLYLNEELWFEFNPRTYSITDNLWWITPDELTSIVIALRVKPRKWMAQCVKSHVDTKLY